MPRNIRNMLLAIILLVALTTVVFAGGGGESEEGGSGGDMMYTDNPYTDGADLSGTTVNVFGAFVDNDARNFEISIQPFIEATGINIVYEGSGRL